MRTLVVWLNQNNNSYYYRFVKVLKRGYRVGYINQYNHRIVLVIRSQEVQPIIIKNNISIRKAILTPIINVLEWLNQ